MKALGVSVSLVFDAELGVWVAYSPTHKIEVDGATQHDAFWGLMRKIMEVVRRRRIVPITAARKARERWGER